MIQFEYDNYWNEWKNDTKLRNEIIDSLFKEVQGYAFYAINESLNNWYLAKRNPTLKEQISIEIISQIFINLDQAKDKDLESKVELIQSFEVYSMKSFQRSLTDWNSLYSKKLYSDASINTNEVSYKVVMNLLHKISSILYPEISDAIKVKKEAEEALTEVLYKFEQYGTDVKEYATVSI